MALQPEGVLVGLKGLEHPDLRVHERDLVLACGLPNCEYSVVLVPVEVVSVLQVGQRVGNK